ncbi:hypothetical protein RQP46_002298 [Phenoliferia psychrophenolica]
MRTSFAIPAVAVALASSLVGAAPLKRADAPAKMDIDTTILQYALTLEHLEYAFYSKGLAMFNSKMFLDSEFPDWVRYRLTEIASHEKNHVAFLSGALAGAGVAPTAACVYDFPFSNPAGFLAVAQVLEGVGTSAYLGAAPLITNPAYVAAAGSILTVEARHSTWIRSAAQHEDGFPNAYDTPLDFNQVYSLASQFITSCPASNPALPVKAFPVLTLATAGQLQPEMMIKLTYPDQKDAFAIFLSQSGQDVAALPASGEVMIPAGLSGPVYVVVSSKNGTVSDDTTLAGPAVVEVFTQATLFDY